LHSPIGHTVIEILSARKIPEKEEQQQQQQEEYNTILRFRWSGHTNGGGGSKLFL